MKHSHVNNIRLHALYMLVVYQSSGEKFSKKPPRMLLKHLNIYILRRENLHNMQKDLDEILILFAEFLLNFEEPQVYTLNTAKTRKRICCCRLKSWNMRTLFSISSLPLVMWNNLTPNIIYSDEGFLTLC